MTQVTTLLRSDLRRLSVPLGIWGLAGMYLLVAQVVSPTQGSTGDSLQILSLFLFMAIGVVTIAWAIQEDSARDPNAFWRSRPIAPMTMLGAKLCLLIALFVIIPIVGIVLVESLSPGSFRRIDGLPNVLGFLLCGVLTCSALAACTRNLGEYLIVGMIVIILVANFMTFLATHDSIDARTSARLAGSRFFVSTAVCGLGGILTLIAQYQLRRLPISFGLICTTLLTAAATCAFWPWKII